MTEERASIAAKSLWTMGTYVASAAIRFASNIVLSRLLGPEILGIVVIAQAVRAGTDLLTDIGLEQNVVHSSEGDDERFLNTVWTLQVLRGVLISMACIGLAPLLARFYRVDVAVLLAISAAPFVSALMSTSIYTLVRRMDVKTRNVFEVATEAIGLAINITLAFTMRSVWAPILGILLGLLVRTALSYTMPHPHHRLLLDRRLTPQILHFSKWIMLSSLALYAAIYIDRLFLGRILTLAMLGVYGLARAVSDLPQTVAGRLAFQVVFPFVAQNRDGLGPRARVELGRTRRHFLSLVALGIATVMAWSDYAVHLLYGPKYAEAGWMLCLLLGGSWIGTLASLNEASVFGNGRPQNVSFANLLRIAVTGVALPAGFAMAGFPGALLALPLSECVRYCVLLSAQRRLGTMFIAQDAALSLGLLALFGGWVAVRLAAGLSVPWALIH